MSGELIILIGIVFMFIGGVLLLFSKHFDSTYTLRDDVLTNEYKYKIEDIEYTLVTRVYNSYIIIRGPDGKERKIYQDYNTKEYNDIFIELVKLS